MSRTDDLINVDLELQTPVLRSFRVDQAAGMFDLPHTDTSTVRITAQLPRTDGQWKIGLIVGPSGSGKSSLARHVFGDKLDDHWIWPRDQSILDGFPASMDGRDVTRILNSVGLSSPPSWLRPYHVLSTGEKFRCNLARALCAESELVAVDEFTSVVDRTVARIGSHCLSRSMRQQRARCKRFVAISCHYDIIDWLAPDWLLDMQTGKLERGRLRRRPQLQLYIHRCRSNIWPMFSKHHYLSGKLNPSAQCFLATINNRPVAFCAVIANAGHKRSFRISRIVTLPDFQGMGIGGSVCDWVGSYFTAAGKRLSISTSHPCVVGRMHRSKLWRQTHLRRTGNLSDHGLGHRVHRSAGRCLISFQFLGPAHVNRKQEQPDRSSEYQTTKRPGPCPSTHRSNRFGRQRHCPAGS